MLSAVFFFFAIVLLGAMILYRVWEIRAGRFNLEELSGKELVYSPAHLETLNNKFLDFLREAIHIALVLLVRLAIGILFVIRRESKRLSTKLDHFFLHNGTLHNKGSVSVFLKDIAKYKDKIKNINPRKK
ncbi:MAG: hypothetical protein AAB507_01565 [Patescibacteria group bacterium]